MRADLINLISALNKGSFPDSFDELFGTAWSKEAKRFVTQETLILDFKESLPENFTESYGASIIRLALSFYNAFGGFVVFGVVDRKLEVEAGVGAFDVESFNRCLSDFCGISIECLSRRYQVPDITSEICVLMVPKRLQSIPAKLSRDLYKYKKGTIWLRERHECLEAQPRHLPVLYSSRDLAFLDREDTIAFPVHRSLPPSPATMKKFVSRGHLLDELWEWLVFGDRPRMYLHGPGGSGKSTLAFEFAKLLSEYGHSIHFGPNERFDYVVYISGKETELNVQSTKEQPFSLRQFKTSGEQFAQILFHSGLLDENILDQANERDTLTMLSELFATFNGLIVIDDIDALSRRQVDTGEETLFLQCVKSSKRNRVLYTLRNAPAHAFGSALPVPGLNSEDELHNFLELCCKEFDVPVPSGEHIPLLQQETASLPLLIETVVGIRRFSSNYQQALQIFKDKGGDEARRYLYQR